MRVMAVMLPGVYRSVVEMDGEQKSIEQSTTSTRASWTTAENSQWAGSRSECRVESAAAAGLVLAEIRRLRADSLVAWVLTQGEPGGAELPGSENTCIP